MLAPTSWAFPVSSLTVQGNPAIRPPLGPRFNLGTLISRTNSEEVGALSKTRRGLINSQSGVVGATLEMKGLHSSGAELMRGRREESRVELAGEVGNPVDTLGTKPGIRVKTLKAFAGSKKPGPSSVAAHGEAASRPAQGPRWVLLPCSALLRVSALPGWVSVLGLSTGGSGGGRGGASPPTSHHPIAVF